MTKYYSFITPSAVGIFTNWTDVEAIVSGTRGAQHKSFKTYDAAQSYIIQSLSDPDKKDFGLDKNQLYINKKFIRKQQYISKKEADKRTKTLLD